MKLDILAIGAHPDDVEISACGTLLRHLDLGKKIGILDLTAGELGTRGSASLRLEEAAKAARLLGLHARVNLQLPDGFFDYSQENLLEIIRIIRYFKPEIVLANSLSDRHPDHGRAAKLSADACFYAGLIKIQTEWEAGLPQEAWRPKAVYHYIQDHNLKPDFLFDISAYFERKLEVVLAYKSQFYDPESKEPETPISGKAFLDFLRAKAQTYGRVAGFAYAEGFNVARTMGVQNLFDLI